jgi:hypothetical protein
MKADPVPWPHHGDPGHPPAAPPNRNRYRLHPPRCKMPQGWGWGWRNCRCPKYLYKLKDGKRTTVSAKTRSWEKAEEQARRIREDWDPVKRELNELKAAKAEKERGEVTIEAALKRWNASLCTLTWTTSTRDANTRRPRGRSAPGRSTWDSLWSPRYQPIT